MARIMPRVPSFTSFISLQSSRSPFLRSIRASAPVHRRMASNAPIPSITPKISPGSNEKEVLSDLRMELLPPQSRWQLTPSGEGIQRLFRFKTFKAAWSFMERVAGECKTAKHHPEWANVYNTVFVRWTTHKPKGLSEKDIAMAMFCDEHAAELGEVVPEDRGEEAAMGEGVEGLVEGIGKIAGDCCVPKKK